MSPTRTPRTTTRTPRTTDRTPIARRAVATALVGGLAAAGLGLASPAAAQTAAPAAGQGWVRVAHLSPDTKSVDVRVSALSGGDVVYELDGVGYGAVSPYTTLADGEYVISMVPAGAADDAPAVISTSVSIDDGQSATVAAYGPNDDLSIRTFSDDLTAPAAGDIRLRVVQASTQSQPVDITTQDGAAIVRDAEAGSVTEYAEIPAGDWELELTSGRISDTADVSLAEGSIATLFVLDTADGGLTVMPVIDSAAVGAVPEGGVPTGGGYLAGLLERPLQGVVAR